MKLISREKLNQRCAPGEKEEKQGGRENKIIENDNEIKDQ